MTDPPPPPRWRRYWMLLAFAAFMATPSPIALPALLAGVGAATGVRLFRFAAERRAGAREAETARAHSVVLGVERRARPVLLSDHQLSAHGLILGASGSGKSTTLLRILSAHIARGSTVVAIDLKGSPAFARVLEQAAARAGRPFRLWTPDGPSNWNPLAHGNPTELKDKLIGTERFSEPHYQRAAERYVQTVLQVLAHAHPERPPTLEEVVTLMEPRRLASMLRRAPRPLADHVQDYVAGLTPDQLSAVRGLGTRLAVITESHLGGRLMSSGTMPPIDLHAALAGPEVVLFSLNSSSYGKLAAQIGTMVVQDLVSAAGERLRADSNGSAVPQAIVAIDEFSALGGDQVLALLARGREAGVSVLVATQELVDLDRAARGLREQVIGNTAVKIVHRQDVPASADTVAQMVGTERVWAETRRIGGPLFGTHDAGRGTRRIVEQFVIHPNTIKMLQTGQALVITKLPETRARLAAITPPPETRARPAAIEPPGETRAQPAAVEPPGQTRARLAAIEPPRGTGPRPTRPNRAGPSRGAQRGGPELG